MTIYPLNGILKFGFESRNSIACEGCSVMFSKLKYSIIVAYLLMMPFFGNLSIHQNDPTHAMKTETRFLPSYSSHGPISITTNEDFETLGFPGNGSYVSPYVIEGFEITTDGTCVQIQNIDVFFVIQNCLLNGGMLGWGISLDNVTHGQIRNNNITQKAKGVFLQSSSGISILNNTISSSSEDGVYFSESSENTLVNCSITGNNNGIVIVSVSSDNLVKNNSISSNGIGILIGGSPDNTILRNTFSNNAEYGICIDGAQDNTLQSNILVNNDFYLWPLTAVDYWRQNISEDNLIDGKPLGYFWNKTGEIIDGSYYSRVILANCTWMTIKNGFYENRLAGIQLAHSSNCALENNILSGNTLGTHLFYSSDNLVKNNTFSGNSENGLELINSPSNIVANNTSSGNLKYGIRLSHSSNNVLANNTVISNAFSGILLSISSNNVIAGNYLSGNSQGLSLFDSSSNSTVLDNTCVYNSGYGVYCATGGSHLLYLNVFAFNSGGNAYDHGDSNKWNSTGIGNYWSDLGGSKVYNISGTSNSIDYYPFLYPGEDINPTIDHPADIQYEIGTSGHSITWNPNDENPSRYMIYHNGTLLVLDNWNGSSIETSVDELGLGAHEYSIVVYDTSGNSVTDLVFVLVLSQPTSPTTTTTTYPTTTTTTTSTGTTTPDNSRLFVFGGVGIAAVVVLIVILRLKRK